MHIYIYIYKQINKQINKPTNKSINKHISKYINLLMMWAEGSDNTRGPFNTAVFACHILVIKLRRGRTFKLRSVSVHVCVYKYSYIRKCV